jgi:hypothetical protein
MCIPNSGYYSYVALAALSRVTTLTEAHGLQQILPTLLLRIPHAWGHFQKQWLLHSNQSVAPTFSNLLWRVQQLQGADEPLTSIQPASANAGNSATLR